MQNALDMKRIDSTLRTISERAATKRDRVVEGSLMLEGNKTCSTRFHLNENVPEMIVVKGSLKDHLTLYYFNDRKLIYVANFESGNYNEIGRSVCFTNNTACKKEKSVFKKVNSKFFSIQVEGYFDLFKEQLKAEQLLMRIP